MIRFPFQVCASLVFAACLAWPALPPAGADWHREVVLHRHEGSPVSGRFVDYLPEETYVLATPSGEKIEVPEADVEQVEFADVRRHLEREGRYRRPLDPAAREVHEVVLADGERYNFNLRVKESPEGMILFWRGLLQGAGGGMTYSHFVDLGSARGDTAVKDAPPGLDLGWLEDGRLVAGDRVLRTYELFARFLDPAPMRLSGKVSPRSGNRYLYRAVSPAGGRGCDLVVVLEVVEVGEGSVRLRWEEFLSWTGVELLGFRVAEAREWASRAEWREGDALLWSRFRYGDYIKATYSFEFATRDGGEIAGNDWDILFGNSGPFPVAAAHRCGGDESGDCPGGVSGIREIDPELTDTGDPQNLAGGELAKECALRRGRTYLVHSVDMDSDVWAIFKVTDIDPARWVKIHWQVLRRDGAKFAGPARSEKEDKR